MRVFVTGAAGFIGSHIAEYFKEKGDEVAGLDAFTDFYDPKLKRKNAEILSAQGITIYEKNLVTDDLSDAVAGADVIIHAAAQPGLSVKDPAIYEKNNVFGTERILEAALTAKPKLFLNLSSSSVYGLSVKNSDENAPTHPASPYGATKLAAEKLVFEYANTKGLPAATVRPFSIYGERERPEKLIMQTLYALKEKRPLTMFEGSEGHTRSFTYVLDLVEAIHSLIRTNKRIVGEVFNVGNPETSTVEEVIGLVEEAYGEKVLRAIAPARPGTQNDTKANIQKIKTLTGWQPTTALREGIEREVSWFKKEIEGR